MIYQKWDCSLYWAISYIKGGFDHVNLLQQAEQGFDRLFGYNRQLSESFDYRNTVKNGSISEQFKIQNQDFTGEEGSPLKFTLLLFLFFVSSLWFMHSIWIYGRIYGRRKETEPINS